MAVVTQDWVAEPQRSTGTQSAREQVPMWAVALFISLVVLAMDLSQLVFALAGAATYGLFVLVRRYQYQLQLGKATAKTEPAQGAATPKAALTLPKTRSGLSERSDVRQVSHSPVAAPSFKAQGWDAEVVELLGLIMPNKESDQTAQRIAGAVKRAISKVIPEADVTGFASAKISGRHAFGVAVPDIDIVISVSPDALVSRLRWRLQKATDCPESIHARMLQKAALRVCADKLVSNGGFRFRRSAFQRTEPKITFLVPASLGLTEENVPIDLAVNAATPLYSAALLTECGKMDLRAKELLLLVRRWAKDRGICHAAKGDLSPYAWNLLVIYFLQVGEREEGAMLPPLSHFSAVSGLLPEPSEKTGQWQPLPKGPSSKAAATLMKDFIRFYSKEFNWRDEAISILRGQRAPPAADLAVHIIEGTFEPGPTIEDPFQKNSNLGCNMTSMSLKRLHEELQRADELCSRCGSLTELLQPWCPETDGQCSPSNAGDDEEYKF